MCVVPTVGRLTEEKHHNMLRKELVGRLKAGEGQKIKFVHLDACSGFRTRQNCIDAEIAIREDLGRHVPVDTYPKESTPILTTDPMLHLIWLLV